MAKAFHDMPFATDSSAPRQAARMAYEAYPVQPTTLVSYISRGHVLIIGKAAWIEAVLGALSPSLGYCALCTDACSQTLAQALAARKIAYIDRVAEPRIEGYLGAFQVTVPGLPVDLHKLFEVPQAHFDLILDLLEPPVLRRAVLPVGYFAPAGDSRLLREILAELPEMVGEFDKPKFFSYLPEICAHGARGVSGCRLCLDACAAGAIVSSQEEIEVDPYLCQGCGDCATVCPAGAINYTYPARRDTLNRLRRMLEAYFQAGGQAPLLLLHDDREGKAWLMEQTLPDPILPYEVESLSSVGMEIWLAALAYGAAAVLLLDPGNMTGQSEEALSSQLTYAGEILTGMGYAPSCLRLVRADAFEWQAAASMPAGMPQARFGGIDEKRTALRWAVEHLHRQAPEPASEVALSPGAPFGKVEANRERCTLCMACVSVCPEAALEDGRDRPLLKFIEANCVQCGLCESACPEDAITRAPRYLYDTKEARRPRILHEEAVFHCIACGKPFATQSMIKTIMARLQDHPMFQGENRRRLAMCEDCRVKSQFGG